MQNGIVEVQVQPCSSATLQNRLAENRGWITQVRADPQARQHRIGQRVGVKQRQIGLVHVALRADPHARR